MKSILGLLFLLLAVFPSSAQTVPFPAATPYNVISPWGHGNTGTTWNTAPYIPFKYRGAWFRMMPPNEVLPTITHNPDGTIANVSFNYTVPGKKYPLILFFQGAGEVGTDNNKQLLHGGEKHKNAVLSNQFPGYLVYPQSTYVDKAKEIIEEMIRIYPIDPNRIYVHGLSNGAKWTWEFGEQDPTLVAAMAPMSGVIGNVPGLIYTPIRLAQGGLDKNPNPDYAQTVVDYYNNNGSPFEYFFFPTLGHGTWNTMYNRADFFSWFLQHKLNNIKVLFNKTEYCVGETINTKMGFAPGLQGYEWYKDGILIPGQTSNNITVTELGTYTGRINNRGTWYMSDPVEIKIKAPTVTPPIQLAQLQSVVIPDINGISNVVLTLPSGYETYEYSKTGTGIIGTNQSITVSTVGTYTAIVKEFGGCSSTASVPFTITDANGTPKPDPISNLQVTTLSKTQLRLNWDNTLNPSLNETGFEIYRSLVAGGPYTLIHVTQPDVLVYTDNNLSSNTTYYYRIRPIANTGAAAASTAASGVTDVDVIPPTAPNNLAVTSTSQTSVGLSWSASTDNVGVTGYDVYVRAYGQTNYIKAHTTTATSQLVTSLTPSTLYNFIVKAKDQAGNVSVASNQVNAATVLTGLNYSHYHGTWSLLPDFSALTPATTGVVSTFSIAPRTQNDNFGFVFTGFLQIPTTGSYTFYTSSDDGSKLWVNGVLIVNNDGLHGTQERQGTMTLNAGYYPIRCEFFEAGGGEALTVSWQGPGISKQAIPASRLRENYTLPAAPSAPTGLARTVVDYKTIRINWNTYTGTGTDIEVYRSSPNSNAWNIIATIPASQNTYTDTNLNFLTRYYYRLRAVNSGNVSAYTSSVNGTTPALPPPPAIPTGLQLVDGSLGPNTATISWTDNSTNEDNFEVHKSVGTADNFIKAATLPANTTQYVDNTLFAHTQYFYKVLSKNVAGTTGDGFSNQLEVNTLNNSPVLDPIANIVVRYDEERTVQITASDPDNDFLVFEAAGLPPFAQLFDYGDGSAYLVISPAGIANVGEYLNPQIIVRDAYSGNHSLPFTITVNSNHNPVITPVLPQTVKETNTLQFSMIATDSDNDAITWAVANAPVFMTSAPNGNNLDVTMIPLTNHAGTYNITFTATDVNGGSATTIVTVNVEDYDPNYTVKVNFRTYTASNGPSDWNNVGNTSDDTPIPTTALNKENGTPSGITFSSTGQWTRYKDDNGVTPGVYPNAVNSSLFRIWNKTAGETLTLVGLNPQGKYNLKFLSSTKLNTTYNNLAVTTFTISGQSQQIDAVGNASTLVTFSQVTPNAQGEVSINVKTVANGFAILNAMVIESYFEGTTAPEAPSNLQVATTQAAAIQVTWTDNSGGETSQELYRSLDDINFVKLATLATDVTSYIDSDFVAGNTYYYKVLAKNSIGISAFSNTGSIVAPNRVPVILPVSPITMAEQEMKWVEVTGTDVDGDPLTFELENEPSFMWSEYVDDNRVNLVFSPSLGEKGTYQFLLHCDDPNGGRTTANLSVTVYSASDVEFKINFTGTSIAAAPWNNMTSFNTGTVLNNLKNNNNTPVTGVSITLVQGWNGLNTNGYNTGNNSGIYPDAAMSGSFYIQDGATKTIQLAGLNSAKTYDFTFFASRMGVADVRNTIYTSGSKSAILNASGNTSNTAKIIRIKPNASGQITITVAKEGAAAFGYLGAMVIREYDEIVVPTVPQAPTSLISQVLTRTSIKLNWQDASNDETSFEIWRSVGGNTNYSLLTTVAAGTTTFINTGLATSTQYYYKVAARNAIGLSPFSNETNGSTYDYSVSINFNAFNGSAPGWNNVTAFYTQGNTLNNLVDDAGFNAGISMTVVEEFAGTNPWGSNTGNNSGIVPDNVMVGSWWIDAGTQAKLRFNNLSFLKKYNFSFFANRDAGGDRTTVFTINNSSVNINASFNISNLVQIKDISPELDGTITITITTTQGAQFGYLNGLIIQAVPNTGGGARIAGKSADVSNSFEEVKTGTGIQVYPNPFVDRITMQLGSDVPNRFKVSIVNSTGLTVFNSDFERQPDIQELELLLDQNLSEGVYIMRVMENSGYSKNIRLVKR
ncbi:MAG: fibronectin type III domain-containing protein [Cyclobacteriaceae bacterium]|nr:fibronectin type III domain-containing protein [Cyclobacteriaceae bacterium]